MIRVIRIIAIILAICLKFGPALAMSDSYPITQAYLVSEDAYANASGQGAYSFSPAVYSTTIDGTVSQIAFFRFEMARAPSGVPFEVTRAVLTLSGSGIISGPVLCFLIEDSRWHVEPFPEIQMPPLSAIATRSMTQAGLRFDVTDQVRQFGGNGAILFAVHPDPDLDDGSEQWISYDSRDTAPDQPTQLDGAAVLMVQYSLTSVKGSNQSSWGQVKALFY